MQFMTTDFSATLAAISDFVCGYPLFLTLIGGGLFLFITSRCISLRCLPYSLSILRDHTNGSNGPISPLDALAAVAAATPACLAAADLVAPSNQEDGVAQVLGQWFGA